MSKTTPSFVATGVSKGARLIAQQSKDRGRTTEPTIDKQKAKLQKLNFVSMSSDGEKEFRFFDNGQLTFNKENAILILDNNEFKLEVLSTELELNMNIQQAIMQFTINLK